MRFDYYFTYIIFFIYKQTAVDIELIKEKSNIKEQQRISGANSVRKEHTQAFKGEGGVRDGR